MKNKNTQVGRILTQATLQKLQPGMKVRLVTNDSIEENGRIANMRFQDIFGPNYRLNNHAGQVISIEPGHVVTVKNVNPGNDLFTVQEYPSFQCYRSYCMEPDGQIEKTKVPKFSNKDVQNYAIEGGNARLKQEMTVRINNARQSLTESAKDSEFHKQMRNVAEQLRQLRLIQRAIRPVIK